MDLEEEVLNLIKNNKNGITQSLIWKELNIDSRKCSRIIKKLVDSNLVTKENTYSEGARTYLIKYNNKGSNFCLLFAGNIFSPCTGCTSSCMPEYCPALTRWVISLNKSPEEYIGHFGDIEY